MIALALLLAGSPAQAEAPDTDHAATADRPAPSAAQEAVYRALSARHDAPTCDDLDALATDLSEDPAETYAFVAAHATQPPWVGMRAARCLIVNHPQDARAHMERWVVDPDTRGFGILALQNLDAVPVDIATAVATAALTDGPDPADVRTRLLKAERAEIRALAELPVAPGPVPAEVTP